jgi:hypothetical protein
MASILLDRTTNPDNFIDYKYRNFGKIGTVTKYIRKMVQMSLVARSSLCVKIITNIAACF